jgi:hypothetical protein
MANRLFLTERNWDYVTAAEAYIPEDGVQDCTAAINAVFASGANLSLTPGVTYIVSNTIKLASGSKIRGNGAIIKRAAQKSTTTTTPITSGVTFSFIAADASQLRVGQRIVLQEVAVPSNYDQNPRVIDSINGNLVICTTTFGITVASGTINVYIAYPTLDTIGDNLVDGLVFDGNATGWTFARWEWGIEIHVLGNRNVVQRCYVHDTAGEGLTIASGSHNRVSNCWFDQIKGNGIHMSGCTSTRIENVSVENSNLDLNVGHADGAIIWSNAITDVVVSKCYVNTTTLAAIGSIDSSDNSHVTVADCEFRNCGLVLDAKAGSATDVPTNLTWVNNRIYDCVIFEWRNTASPTNFLGHLICTGNYFKNTKIHIARSKGVTFNDNEIDDAGDAATVQAAFAEVSDLTCIGNRIEGGLYGLYFDGACANLLVSGNVLKNQNTGAIRFETTYSGENALVEGNSISNAAGASASYFGILPRANVRMVNNDINLTGGGGATGIYGISDSQATGNKVIKGAASFTMKIDGGNTNVVFGENFVTNAAVDTPGTNTIRNEVIIT